MNRRFLLIAACGLFLAGLIMPARALAASITIVHSCDTWGEVLPCA